MTFLANEKIDRLRQLAWWLCVITLPWTDMANNICLIFLVLIWIMEGKFKIKWGRLKRAR